MIKWKLLNFHVFILSGFLFNSHVIGKCSLMPDLSIMEERIKFLPVAVGQKEWRTLGFLPRNGNQSEPWNPAWHLAEPKEAKPSLRVNEVR